MMKWTKNIIKERVFDMDIIVMVYRVTVILMGVFLLGVIW